MRRIERAARRVGMSRGDLRLELLDTIKEQTIAAYEQQRGREPAPAIAGGSIQLSGVRSSHKGRADLHSLGRRRASTDEK